MEALQDALQLARDLPRASPDVIHQMGRGAKGPEALAIGLYAALQGTSFVETLTQGAHHNGGSDITVALAGAVRSLAWHDQLAQRLGPVSGCGCKPVCYPGLP